MLQLMFAVVLCAPTQAKFGDAKLSDDDKFLLERAEKALLDPKSSDKRFGEGLETCGRFGRFGAPLLTKALAVYEKRKDKEGVQRHARCFYSVMGICREQPSLFPDSLLPKLFVMLERHKTNGGGAATDLIRMCGRLKGRAEKALPVLREILDGENTEAALEALQAIRFIEADLKKKG